MISIDLSGKIALVTGSSQGIGQACAMVLARAGASVALAARNEENLRRTASDIIAAGGRAEAMAGDLTASGRTERVVEETCARFGGIDILVNAAGVSRRSDPIDTTDEDIDLAIDLKLRAAIRLTKAAIPKMRKRGGGVIVYFLRAEPCAHLGIPWLGLHIERRLIRLQASARPQAGAREHPGEPHQPRNDGHPEVCPADDENRRVDESHI